MLNNYEAANFEDVRTTVADALRSFHAESASENARRALFERVDTLYREIAERELDVDATLSSNERLLDEAFEFIRQWGECNDASSNLRTPPKTSFDRAISLIDQIIAAATRSNNRLLFAKSNFFQGQIFEARFDFHGALERYDLALLNADSPHHYVLAAATCARKLCNIELARNYLEPVVSRSSGSGLELLDRCRALNELAGLRETGFDLDGAISCLSEAERISRALEGNESLAFRIKNNIGHCLLSNNDSLAALPFIAQSFEFFYRNRFQHRVDYISIAQNMAEVLRKINELRTKGYSPFISSLRDHLDDTREMLEIENYAIKYSGAELDEAEIILYDCLSFSKRAYGRFGAHPLIANVMNNLGVFLITQRKSEAEGEGLVREAAEMMEALFTEYNPRLVNMLINIGILEGRRNPSMGVRRLNRAELLARRLFDRNDPIFDVIDEERAVIEARSQRSTQ